MAGGGTTPSPIRAPSPHRPGQLDVQPDLFGGVQLIRAWGRIGAFGRVVAEHYHSETLATDAMQRHAETKKRRGYM